MANTTPERIEAKHERNCSIDGAVHLDWEAQRLSGAREIITRLFIISSFRSSWSLSLFAVPINAE